MPAYYGQFQTNSGERVEVHFHLSGLEEYLVDGEVALKSRAVEFTGVREFKAGDHSVRIRFCLRRLYCKAYVDGKLVEADLFPKMQKERRSRMEDRRAANPTWVTVVRWMLIAYLGVNVLG